jgi:hypothetical protein
MSPSSEASSEARSITSEEGERVPETPCIGVGAAAAAAVAAAEEEEEEEDP